MTRLRSKLLQRRAEWLYRMNGQTAPESGLLAARAQQAADQRTGTTLPARQRAPGDVAIPAADTAESSWQQIGPAPISSANSSYASLNGGSNSGRVNAVAVATTARWYVVSAAGGVWKTTDAGLSWTPLTDSQASLAGSSIAIVAGAPTDGSGDTLWVGTGEANCSADSYYGAGILKSTDGGTTWTRAGVSLFGAAAIAKVVVDPSNASRLYASASGCFASKVGRGALGANVTGLARSIDGGATWALITDSNSGFAPGMWSSDVAVASDGTVYAVRSQDQVTTKNGVYKSTDNGTTFTKLTIPLVADWGNVYRIELATAPSNSQVVYVALSDNRSATSGQLYDLVKTSDGGASWSSVRPSVVDSDGFQGSASDQYWYDINLAVHPTDPNTAYLLGINVIKTIDGGSSWTNLTQVYGTARKIHPDQHGIAIASGSPNTVVVGNDGGVAYTTDGGATWAARNGSGAGALAILQGYRGASSPTGGTFYAGLQDNGQVKWTGSLGWTEVYGGDGGYTEVDYTTTNTVYEEYVYLAISRSDDAGSSWTDKTSGITEADFQLGGEDNVPNAQFIAPFVIDPTTPTTLYAGSNKVWKTTNRGDSWAVLGGNSTALTTTGNSLTAIGVAKSNSQTVYAGDNTGKIYYTHDGGVSWTTATVGLPTRFVTDLAVDPTNDQIAYATFGGFTTLGHVFKTINGGTTWTVAGTLPDAPQMSVAIDPSDPQTVYVGGDLGVYKSTNAGLTWSTLNTGLPNSPVWHLVISRDGSKMFAVTHGRSVFMATRSAASTATPTNTPVTPSATNTPVTPSSTPATPSSTPLTATNTPVPGSTATPGATSTNTPVTPSSTPVTPSATTQPAASPTVRATRTATATSTPLVAPPAQSTVLPVVPTSLPTSIPTPDTSTGGSVAVVPTAAAGSTGTVGVVSAGANAPFPVQIAVPASTDAPIGVRLQPATSLTGVTVPEGATVTKVVQIDVFDPTTGAIIHDHATPLTLTLQLSSDERQTCATNPALIAILHVDSNGFVTRVLPTSVDCATGNVTVQLSRTSSYAVASLTSSTTIPFRSVLPISPRNLRDQF